MNVYPTETKEEDLAIAKTIIEQIGLNNFKRLGCHSAKAIKAGVQFKTQLNRMGLFAVVIRLMADDTYEVSFFKKNGAGEDITTVNDVYCDQLTKLVGEAMGFEMIPR